jgi:hypothetical protein
MNADHEGLFIDILSAMRKVAAYGSAYGLPGLRPFPELYRLHDSEFDREKIAKGSEFESLITRGIYRELHAAGIKCWNECPLKRTEPRGERCDLVIMRQDVRYWIEYKIALTRCLEKSKAGEYKWDYSGTRYKVSSQKDCLAPFQKYVPEDMRKLSKLNKSYADFIGVLVTVFDHAEDQLSWATIEANLPEDFRGWTRVAVSPDLSSWRDFDPRRGEDGYRETTYLWIKPAPLPPHLQIKRLDSLTPEIKLRDASVQEIQLELLRRSKWNALDGERVVADLFKHRELWTAVLLDRLHVWEATPRDLPAMSLIKLRDLDRNIWNADTLYILATSKEAASTIAMLAEQEWAGEPRIIDDPEEVSHALGGGRPGSNCIVTVWWD